MAKVTLVTAPANRLITAADLRAHCRIDDSAEDESLEQLIDSATEAAESYTWRRFVTQTWDQSFDAFANPLILKYPPVASVTSVTYTDANGDSQTASSSTLYETGKLNGLDVVRLRYGQVWPATRGHEDVVTVRFICGEAVDDVPEPLKQAVRLHAAHFYENREGQAMPDGFYALLYPFQFRGT